MKHTISKILFFMACLLLASIVANAEEPTQLTIDLIQSIANNDLIKAESCIKKGANINGYGDFTNGIYTPIKTASIDGNDSAIKLLLKYKANPNNTVGGIPLLYATAKGHFSTVKLLLSGGADPNLKTEDGLTALDLGIEIENIDIVKVLLSNGANPNIGSSNPLISAVSTGNIDIVKLLLQSGADPYVNKDDIIIKAEYAKKNDREMAALIRKAVNQPVKPFPDESVSKLKRAPWADNTKEAFKIYGYMCNDIVFTVGTRGDGVVTVMGLNRCDSHKANTSIAIEAQTACDCYSK